MAPTQWDTSRAYVDQDDIDSANPFLFSSPERLSDFTPYVATSTATFNSTTLTDGITSWPSSNCFGEAGVVRTPTTAVHFNHVSNLQFPSAAEIDPELAQNNLFSLPFEVNNPLAAIPSPDRIYFEQTDTGGTYTVANTRGLPSSGFQPSCTKFSHPSGHGEISGSGHGCGRAPMLRTAARKPQQGKGDGFPTSNDGPTPKERSARSSHNRVEKAYRNRLNATFEKLLAVLPTKNDSGDREASGDEGSTAVPGIGDKRISKAEVLDTATRRIKELEQEQRQLEWENQDLSDNLNIMREI